MIVLYIVIALIVIGIISSIIEKLSDMVGGRKVLVVLIVLYIVSFLALSWIGVLIITVVLAILALIRSLGRGISSVVKDHDEEKKNIAQIKQNTQISKEIHDNDMALDTELRKNCTKLGYMNVAMWKAKLPNYVNKQYSEDFTEITYKFAKQIEAQNITQNDDWFQPFVNYLVIHPQGATVIKMLSEVQCLQFNYTHATPDENILYNRLIQGTKRIQGDVPPVFSHTSVGENGEIFTLSAYGQKLYCTNNFMAKESHVTEMDISEL